MLFYLRLCLFACCLPIMAFATTDSDNADSMVDNQSKLFRIQTDIHSIDKALTTGANTKYLFHQLDTLTEEFRKLKEGKTNVSSEGNCNIAFTMLNNHYNVVEVQLRTVLLALHERKQVEHQRGLLTTIITAIRRYNFFLAENELQKLNNNEEIPKIIQTVYANSSNNFDVLVHFSQKVKLVYYSYYVLKALHEEMVKNDHRDPYKLITLVRTMKSNVVHQPYINGDMKANTEAAIDEILESIKTTAVDILKPAVHSGKFESKSEVDKLVNTIYFFHSDMFDTIMQRIVNDAYGMVASKTILDYISSHKYIDQRIAGIRTLFWKMKGDRNLNNNLTLDLASYLRKLRLDRNFKNSLSQEKKDAIDKIIKNLPNCARNLFFQPLVCFWNAGKEEYIYAANSTIALDGNVYSEENPDSGSHQWYAEKSGNIFLFKNFKYSDEYLYASAFDFNNESRYVITKTIPGDDKTDEKAAWSIELDGDYCYLKNAYFNEHLFASNTITPDSKRYVFTWKPKSSVRRSEFEWQIKNCD